MSSEVTRLNKYIAHCGVCSRRKAADLVKAGQILVNGNVELNPSYMVKPEDQVTYQGKVLEVEENKVYLLMNKPKMVITSLADEKGRRTVIDLLRNKIQERVYPVGRLDYNTTGLLVLTNDGALASKLAHPSYEVKKLYHVTLDKPVLETDLEKIKKGLILEDGIALVDEAHFVPQKTDEVMLEIHQGKNRIVRRIFEHLDYRVIRLDRVFYAGLTKKDLPRGFFRRLTAQEVIMLKHFSKR